MPAGAGPPACARSHELATVPTTSRARPKRFMTSSNWFDGISTEGGPRDFPPTPLRPAITNGSFFKHPPIMLIQRSDHKGWAAATAGFPMAKSTAARAEARFKQLCCLGFDAETVVPALLNELHALI